MLVSKGAVRKYHQPGDLKQQFILSVPEAGESGNQGVRKFVFLKSLRSLSAGFRCGSAVLAFLGL